LSKIAISGASSGTATFTIESPATSTNRTLTLPDNTGTIITQNSTPAFASTIGVGGATAAASGAGITFPATVSASSDANTLDDYEEGTFTPNLIGESGGEATYSIRDGTYTKIGRQVTVNINMAIASKGTMSGNVAINTLPFTVGDTLANTSLEANGTVTFFGNLSSAVSSLTVAAISNTTNAIFYRVIGTSATSSNALTVAEINTNFDFRASITYFV
jgi:hypothetical protein